MSDDAGFRLEVLKLLLQVAWADDALDPAEANMIFALARRWKLPETDVAALEETARRGGPLPAPNLGLLKAHKGQTLELVKTLTTRDGAVSTDEADMLAQIDALLS